MESFSGTKVTMNCSYFSDNFHVIDKFGKLRTAETGRKTTDNRSSLYHSRTFPTIELTR